MLCFFFFKQKTAYEMRISDWSSDVCSSDLDSVDNAVGILHTKDVLPLALKNEPIAVRAAMVPAVIVPDRTSVLPLLDRFRREGIHMAVMVDQYGTTEGIATPTDLLESLAGDLQERGTLTAPLRDRRSDGTGA